MSEFALPPDKDWLPQMMARAEALVPESEVQERIGAAVAAERERLAAALDSYADGSSFAHGAYSLGIRDAARLARGEIGHLADLTGGES